MFVKKTTLLSAAVLLTLVACGDATRDVAPVTPTVSAGKAVDGYLKDSDVLCAATSTTVKTNATGDYTFTPACASAVTITGGTSVDTGFAFKGKLKGPAGSAIVSPLTTLMADLTPAQTVTLLAALGVTAGTDLTKTDPADGLHLGLLKTTLALHQIVQQMANTFGTLLGSTDVPGLYAKVAAAVTAALLASSTPLFDANGVVNITLVGTIATGAAASVAASGLISAADLAALATQIALQAQQFSTATSAAGIAALAQTLQNPAAPPIDTAGATKFLAIDDDSLYVNGTLTKPGMKVTLAEFATGVSINNLTTIGIPFDVSRAPMVDSTSAIFLELIEKTGGKDRKLQVMIDKVAFKLAAGTLSITPATGAKVYVYGHTANGTDLNMILTDLSFAPLHVVENRINLNFDKIVAKVLASADDTTHTTAAEFTNITGAFDTKIVISNLNLRHDTTAGAEFDLMSASVTGATTAPAIVGRGIKGKLMLTQ